MKTHALILSLALSAPAQQITFTPQAGRDYWIQTNSTLQGRYWVDVQSIPAGGSGAPVTATLPLANAGNAFMRVLCADAPTFWWDWERRGMDVYQLWGLGTNESRYVHSDIPLDWYIDQGDTGWCADINCGPSCSVMTINWWHRAIITTVPEARSVYPEGGGLWWTYDITNFMTKKGVPWRYFAMPDLGQGAVNALTNLLNRGGLAGLAIFPYKVPYAADPLRVHNFVYGGTTGHFVLLKGYRVTDTGLWFEMYDPGSMGLEYADGTRKGLNRAWSQADLMAAMTYWPYMVQVEAPGVPFPQTLMAAEPPPVPVGN